MAERKLGRGLESLLGEARPEDGEEVRDIALDLVHPGAHQPRQEFHPGQLRELADSIRQNGLLQPIIVRPGATGYEIVAGERRARAAKLAGLSTIPAIVRRYDDDQALVLSLVENVQRADLNPIDKALAYRRLVKHLGQTHEEVAKRLGLERPSVSNMIRLLDLPEEVRELVRKRGVSMGHARALLGLRDAASQLRVAERIVREDLSVRATEALVRDGGAGTPKRRTNPRKTAQVMALEDELRSLLGTKVRIQDRKGKGRIQIEYFSPAEFQRVLERLRGETGFSRPG
ncbi:MAG: ParB/RepB/Spo0J family partition protein [Planctomycetota bacterium]|nr:ParB/RepB/Spo0J family partition protein [Planctomycetota bacterium]